MDVFPAGGSSVGEKNLSVGQPGKSRIMDAALKGSTGEDASVAATRTAVVKVRLRPEELEFLRRVAAEDDRSVSSTVRLALREFAVRRGES